MRITLPSGTPAELARPSEGAVGADPSAAPAGLVVIPDIGGLRPLFDEHCQHLADQTGRTVCAPELWPDHADRPLDWRLANVAAIDHVRLAADVIAAADATGGDPVGILGFCMGGMITMQAAGTGRFDRAVPFYGMVRIPDHWKADGMVEPLDALTAPGACPVLAIVGTVDPYTPAEELDALEAAGATVVRYEGADHGFVHDASRPSHRARDAADAWGRALAFLTGA